MITWMEQNLTTSTSSTATTAASVHAPQSQEDVQELEEEQEVQEVEMFGESDAYDASTLLSAVKEEETTVDQEMPPEQDDACKQRLDELVRLSTSASFYYNQQKLNACASMGPSGLSLVLDNQYLVHLLAINKIENVFRVKQIHDYYGGCFICGKQVDFNMKHYQVSVLKGVFCFESLFFDFFRRDFGG